jgi:Calcineurin-like phosphoesterase
MRIVLVSDTHLAPRATAFRRNWEVIARWIEDVRPDWVVHLGDITVDGVRDADELGAARAVFDSLTVPIRFVPGNHDVGDNPLATGRSADHPLDLARLAAYRDLFGSDRWALDAGDWRIVALNAQLLGTGIAEEEAQFRWLEARLSERQGPLGLLLHKPLFRDGPDDSEVHVRYVPAEPRRRLLALLARSDLRFVATGHVHPVTPHCNRWDRARMGAFDGVLLPGRDAGADRREDGRRADARARGPRSSIHTRDPGGPGEARHPRPPRGVSPGQSDHHGVLPFPKTLVTWSMAGKNNFISRTVCMFMDMDRMVGGEFEKGLNQLKSIVEA